MEKGLLHKQIMDFFVRNFDVRQEKEDELETIESIKKGIEFKGTNLWVLIFATFVASLGLNTNSTAVIIGAMLISPLMGPIMGFGLGLGISDFELIKRSFRNFATATVFSVITSTLYFLISPISEAQSELLARTQPTVYDVLIAFFGGLAGIVASSTKSKGNVIPGVAIATALMPPLCTAGFGLATGNLLYFLGAFYLYFINSVFISLATYIGVRVMHFQRKQFVDKVREKLVRKYIIGIAIATMCPAVYLTYNIVRETIYHSSANNFITSELQFPDSQILNREISFDKREIKVVFIGKEVSEEQIQNARNKLADYKLDQTKLVVFQGVNGAGAMDIGNIKSMVMEDFYKNSEKQLMSQQAALDSLNRLLPDFTGSNLMNEKMGQEIKVLFPCIKTISVSKSLQLRVDSLRMDTLTYAFVDCDRALSKQEKEKMLEWLQARTGTKKLRLVVE